MRKLVVALGMFSAGLPAQTYPPPFPRKDASMILQNDRIELWDVFWPKGQPSPMHEHIYDQLSITLTGGSIRVTRPDGKATMGKSEVASVGLVRKGTIHAEEGMSDIPQHKIMIQLKPGASVPPKTKEGLPGAFPREGAAKVLEYEQAAVWDFTWKAGQNGRRHADYLDSVMVFIEGGTIRSVTDNGQATETVHKAGEAMYLPHSSDAHTDEAVTGSPRAIVVELK